MKRDVILTLLLAVVLSGSAFADGLIMPVRPDFRVRGFWAVKYHKVDIKVRDQVADVSIDQAFVNTGSGMIEVQYLFPLPPTAAIDNLTLMVDGKEFKGTIMRAEEARRAYMEIVRTKRDPALLEYVNYGLYRTSAFPLPARQGSPRRHSLHRRLQEGRRSRGGVLPAQHGEVLGTADRGGRRSRWTSTARGRFRPSIRRHTPW